MSVSVGISSTSASPGKRGLCRRSGSSGPGPPAWNEAPRGVRVAPPLAAHGEVEERPGLRCRLAEVTAPAGGGLFGGEDTTELRQNSGRSDRVVKKLFPDVT